MGLKTGVGQSSLEDSFQAGAKASEEALEKINGDGNSILLVFASSKLDQKAVLDGVNSIAKGKKVIGCSTAGEISNKGIQTGSVVVAAINSSGADFITSRGDDMDKNAKKSGQDMAQNLINQEKNLKTVLMFPDGLAGTGAETVKGVQDIIKNKILLLGGSAGDDFASQQTFQYFNNELLTKAVVGLGIKGDINIGVGICHGWIPIGLSRIVTKSEGNIIYELDGKPALDLYKEYMDNETVEKLLANPLISIHEGATHPLGIDMGGDNYLIRQPFYAGQDGSLTCAAEVPAGSRINLMFGDGDSLLVSAKQAAKDSLDQLGWNTPSLVLVFSCGARSLILGSSKSQEIETIKNIFGNDVPIAGFVCYGEQAPLSAKSKNGELTSFFHNETVVIIALS